MENIWFAKVGVKTNISYGLTKTSSAWPVYQKTGLEQNELFYDPFLDSAHQTRLQGVDSVFGMHEHPSCGLDMTARHLAFLRHKLSLKIPCVMLCRKDVFIWVVTSHESKHISSVSLPASVGSVCELCHKMAKSTEQGKKTHWCNSFPRGYGAAKW